MSTAMAPEAELTPELIERVMRLSRENLGQLVELALDQLDGTPANPEQVEIAWRQELTRRWDEIRSSEVLTYSPAEAIAYARQRLQAGKPR